MPNIAAVLREEIARLARKELRAEVEPLRKAVTALRQDATASKKRIRELESELRQFKRQTKKATAAVSTDGGAGSVQGIRFSAKGLASNRRRLGLSAEDFALLAGATPQSIYAWEKGTTPRADGLAAIARLRGIGKREAAERLSALKSEASRSAADSRAKK